MDSNFGLLKAEKVCGKGLVEVVSNILYEHLGGFII